MQPIFEDNHYLAIVKPQGISTEPHFEDEVKQWLKIRDQKPGNVFLKATHRLDRPAAGIVIFAKTDKGLSRMHALMRERQVKKTYLALVKGRMQLKEGTWEDYISKGEKKAYKDKYGKHAILHFKTIKTADKHSLVEFDLVTGRYHQIRLQSFLHGHPIIGDSWYEKNIPTDAIALFHARIEFLHPINKKLCIIESICPFELG
jgi:23S rRNA pseudouridine1911/1915/1917 synthase